MRALEKLGFIFRRQTGSHAIFRYPKTCRFAIVPVHARDIKRSLLFGLLKQADISIEDLRKALR